MVQITNIDHLNFTVSDMNKTIDFYKDLFGFEVKEKGVSSKGNPFVIIGISNKLVLCLSESKDNLNCDSFNHFGINVQDFDETLKEVQSRKIPLLYGGVNSYDNSRSIYIADPNGIQIELSENFAGGL